MKYFYWEKIKSKGDQIIKIKKRKYSLITNELLEKSWNENILP